MPEEPFELPPNLAAWVRLPGPSKIVDAIRSRAERGRSTDKGPLACDLDRHERRQVGRLLGNRWEVSGRPVRLQDLAAVLDGLSPLRLAELTGGPIVTRAEVKARARAETESRAAAAMDALTSAGVEAGVAQTWLADGSRPVDLAVPVAHVWKALPADSVPLAQLAADTLHDAHALDSDRALGRAVARLAAVAHGLERPARSGPAWRAAWRAVGVLCNEVSSRVLTLNLPLTGTAPAAALSMAVPGEPVWLTLRSLAGDWRPTVTGPVHVCENPAIVEVAADRIGRRCRPLICTDGTASAAALELVRGLAQAGCEIRARADFDQAGLVIMDQIRGVAPSAIPWRFDLPSYEAAGGRPSAERLSAACATDPVHEERLMAALLDDLS